MSELGVNFYRESTRLIVTYTNAWTMLSNNAGARPSNTPWPTNYVTKQKIEDGWLIGSLKQITWAIQQRTLITAAICHAGYP